jgi:TPR repeat protein
MSFTRSVLSSLQDIPEGSRSQVGHGGFGTVFKIAAADGCVYADKEMMSRHFSNPVNIRNYFREVFNLILGRHPCVLPLCGWTIVRHGRLSPSILTLFYHNGDLYGNKRNLSATQKSIIAYGIARGLKHLHNTFNIVHRDLKTLNVLLTDEWYPLVADLGLAKQAVAIEHSITPGTNGYQAPELLGEQGGLACGVKVDVWAFAMLLFELIEETDVSTHPFFGRWQPVEQHLREGRRPEARRAAPEQQRWLDWLWATRPADRPMFSEICLKMEGGWLPFPGTDAERFAAYRRSVDAAESALGDAAAAGWRAELAGDGAVAPRAAQRIAWAAIDGDARARAIAAMLYLAGGPLPRSALLAGTYALESEDPLVAVAARIGPGLPPCERGELFEAHGDLQRAAAEYAAAARAGCARALWRWGALLVYNDASLQYADGVRLIEAADALGVVDATFELGKLCLEGCYVPYDEARGVECLERAMWGGHMDAAFWLGRHFQAKLDRPNLHRALQYYQFSVDQTQSLAAEAQIASIRPWLCA